MIDSAVPLYEPDEDAPDGPEEDDRKVIERAKADWTRCEDHWRDNRQAYVDDIRFGRLGEQWDEALKRERMQEGRPCLTVNKLPPFVRQVVNDARQNKPSIKVLPQDSRADPKTAEIYSGLIRNIESSSDADVAYDTAIECAASGGFGFFRLNLAYVDEASFDQDIVFERIANPLTVYPDPETAAADSSDWNIAFVAEWMPKKAFEARYPRETPIDFASADWSGGWKDGERVLVAEYWRRDIVAKRLIALTNGQTVIEDEYDPEAQVLPDGSPAQPTGSAREIEVPRVTCYKVTGDAVLERTEWVGRQIPIVPVYGEEVNLEGRRHFRSLIRDAKDAQVIYNASRTASAEYVSMAPKAPFVVEEGSLVDEDKWAQANRKNYAWLAFKKGTAPPQRQGYPAPATGPLQEALTSSDEMKAIIGIYDAGMGARSNETSGRAIMARQRESDTSTFHFIDNLSRAIRCAGRILIDLIPHIYTPGRIVRILGEDGTPENVRSGTPEEAHAQQQAMAERQQVMQAVYALGAGRYDLTVSVGPAFNSRREEAATQMMELIRAYPAAAEMIGDLLVKNLDWPGADEIAERIQQMMAARSQPQEQQQQQAPPDPTKMAKLQLDAQKNQTDAALEQEKLRIDAFEAETARMKAQHEIAQPTRFRGPAQVNFTGA